MSKTTNICEPDQIYMSNDDSDMLSRHDALPQQAGHMAPSELNKYFLERLRILYVGDNTHDFTDLCSKYSKSMAVCKLKMREEKENVVNKNRFSRRCKYTGRFQSSRMTDLVDREDKALQSVNKEEEQEYEQYCYTNNYNEDYGTKENEFYNGEYKTDSKYNKRNINRSTNCRDVSEYDNFKYNYNKNTLSMSDGSKGLNDDYIYMDNEQNYNYEEDSACKSDSYGTYNENYSLIADETDKKYEEIEIIGNLQHDYIRRNSINRSFDNSIIYNKESGTENLYSSDYIDNVKHKGNNKYDQSINFGRSTLTKKDIKQYSEKIKNRFNKIVSEYCEMNLAIKDDKDAKNKIKKVKNTKTTKKDRKVSKISNPKIFANKGIKSMGTKKGNMLDKKLAKINNEYQKPTEIKKSISILIQDMALFDELNRKAYKRLIAYGIEVRKDVLPVSQFYYHRMLCWGDKEVEFKFMALCKFFLRKGRGYKLLTSRPEEWLKKLIIKDLEENDLITCIDKASDVYVLH